jgi:hypothetical protein
LIHRWIAVAGLALLVASHVAAQDKASEVPSSPSEQADAPVAPAAPSRDEKDWRVHSQVPAKPTANDFLTRALDFWDDNHLNRTLPAVLGLVAVLAGVLVAERAKQAAARAKASDKEPAAGAFLQRLASMPRMTYLVGVLAMCVLGLGLLVQGLHADLVRAHGEIETLRIKYVLPPIDSPSD